MKKRFFAMLMAVVLCLSLLSIPAMAADVFVSSVPLDGGNHWHRHDYKVELHFNYPSDSGKTDNTRTNAIENDTYHEYANGNILPSNINQSDLQCSGYVLLGWADSATASGKQYDVNGKIYIECGLDKRNTYSSDRQIKKYLYSVWGKAFTLNFDANGGRGSLPATQSYTATAARAAVEPERRAAGARRRPKPAMRARLCCGWCWPSVRLARLSPTSGESMTDNSKTAQPVVTAKGCAALFACGGATLSLLYKFDMVLYNIFTKK